MLGLANMGNRHAGDSGMRPDRTVPAPEAEGSDRPDSGPEEQDDEDNELDIARVRKQALQLRRAGEKLDGLSERESEGEESLAGVRGTLSRRTTCPPRKSGPSHDPRMLLTVKATIRKAVPITAFVQEDVKVRLQRRRRDRMVLTEGTDGTLSVRAGDVQSTDLTWDEWSGANLRLMTHLLEVGDLRRRDIEYYLAYSAMIYDLAGRFEWWSILRFDTQYRELQAQHGFVWGAQASQLEMRLLVPKGSQAHGAAASKHKSRPEKLTKQSTILCKMFAARGACKFGEQCKFRHVADSDMAAPKNE